MLGRGSGPYMAPELFGRAENTFKSDIFGFGAILFDLMEQETRLDCESIELIQEHYEICARPRDLSHFVAGGLWFQGVHSHVAAL